MRLRCWPLFFVAIASSATAAIGGAQACSPNPSFVDIAEPRHDPDPTWRPRNHGFIVYSFVSAKVELLGATGRPIDLVTTVLPPDDSGPVTSFVFAVPASPLEPGQAYALQATVMPDSGQVAGTGTKFLTSDEIDSAAPAFGGLETWNASRPSSINSCQPGAGIYLELGWENPTETALIRIQLQTDAGDPEALAVVLVRPSEPRGKATLFLGDKIGDRKCYTAVAIDLAGNPSTPSSCCVDHEGSGKCAEGGGGTGGTGGKGTGGTSGGGGAGGQAGGAGQAGAGGSAGVNPADGDLADRGCTCHLGGRTFSGSLGILVFAAWLVMRRRRHTKS